jgi:chromate reductase
MNVLGIAGSLRRGSYNRLLLRAAAEAPPPGLTVTITDTLRSIPPFDEDVEEAAGEGPQAVERLRREIAAADGVLIATPEYNQSLPGVLKNAIDWLSRPRCGDVLAGKPVALVGATVGRWGTRLAQSALRHVLYATEAAVMPAPSLFVAEATRAFDASGALVDARVREQLHEVLAAFASWMETLGGRRHTA